MASFISWKELPLALTSGSQGWASESVSSGRRWTSPQIYPRKILWWATSSPALLNARSISLEAWMMAQCTGCMQWFSRRVILEFNLPPCHQMMLLQTWWISKTQLQLLARLTNNLGAFTEEFWRSLTSLSSTLGIKVRAKCQRSKARLRFRKRITFFAM